MVRQCVVAVSDAVEAPVAIADRQRDDVGGIGLQSEEHEVEPGVHQVAADLLVASAGINMKKRNWHNVSLEDWDSVIRIDLDGAFYCCKAVLPSMKEQGEGLIINISSWAGKQVGIVTGPAYTAAKHAMNAMNESLNMENCQYGIRACAVCPGEVATPILDNRPIPVSEEDRAKMVQSEDCGDVIRFLAELPEHVCINELTISPTWNRGYIGAQQTQLPSE